MQLQVLILPKHNQRRVNLNKDRDIHNKDKVIHSKDKVIHNKDKDTHNKVVTQDKDKDTHLKDSQEHTLLKGNQEKGQASILSHQDQEVTHQHPAVLLLREIILLDLVVLGYYHQVIHLPHQLLMTLLLMITRPKITHQHRDLKVNNGLHKIKLLIFLQSNLQ